MAASGVKCLSRKPHRLADHAWYVLEALLCCQLKSLCMVLAVYLLHDAHMSS